MPAIVNPSSHTFWLLKPLNGGRRTISGRTVATVIMPMRTAVDRWRSEKALARSRSDAPPVPPERAEMSLTSAVMRALPAAGRGGRTVGTRA